MAWCKVVLFLLDVLFVLAVAFPLSILHWRGTWQLQDYYFMPSDRLNSLWLSFAIGSNVCVIELLLQPLLKDKLSNCRRYVYVLVSRLHLYIHGWAVMCYWRGLWELLDYYLTTGWVNSIVVFCIFQFIMIAAQTIRTAVGLPISLRLDTSRDLLESDLVFKTSHSQLAAFIGDCLFTQFVIVTSTICIWRSIGNILDAFVFPQWHYRSDVVCLIAGSAAALLFHLTSYPLSVISELLQERPFVKLFFEDCIFLVLTWTNMMMWRGAWNLCIDYFLPPDSGNGLLVGAWTSHIIGTIGLMALQLFNNVGLHNVERDGIYDGGEGFDTARYVRALLTDCSLSQKYFKNQNSDDNSSADTVANGYTTNSNNEHSPVSDGHCLLSNGLVSDDELVSDSERSGLLNGSQNVHGERTTGHSLTRLTSLQRLDSIMERYSSHTSPLFTRTQYSQLSASGVSPTCMLKNMPDLTNSRL